MTCSCRATRLTVKTSVAALSFEEKAYFAFVPLSSSRQLIQRIGIGPCLPGRLRIPLPSVQLMVGFSDNCGETVFCRTGGQFLHISLESSMNSLFLIETYTPTGLCPLHNPPLISSAGNQHLKSILPQLKSIRFGL